MTQEALEALQQVETRQLIEQHLDQDPLVLAGRLRNPLVTQQIDLLQRNRKKLPCYYEARAILDPVACEQASSQAAARARVEGWGGALAIDLTCGLGVDAGALSVGFGRVVAVEADPVRAAMARWNFRQLGCTNIEVRHDTAEAFVADYRGPEADLVYLDPSRKEADGRRVFSLEQSSPNVVELLPALKKMGKRVVVKLSPLFDVEACFQVFGDGVQVEVVSLDGECKEVLVRLGFPAEQGPLRATVLKKGEVRRYRFDRTVSDHTYKVENPRFLYVPDVALVKGRTVAAYLAQHHKNNRVEHLAGDYLLSEGPISGFEGSGYELIERLDSSPRGLAKRFRQEGIARANLHRRGYPESAAGLAKRLGLREGGEVELFFLVRPDGEKMVWRAKRLPE